jgi:radical SAM superfamily enzyme YgiQ (UPF0313 family)
MKENISSILKSVSKPGRYSGGEYGQIIKDKSKVKARFAFCFPDTYEIGMSNLGMRILYGVLNQEEDVWCERVFNPWIDMQDKMKEYGIPLTASESGDELKEFDLVGFTLQYEMSYSNILAMMKMGGVPLEGRERGENDPIVVAGGPCAFNPEPLADFIDAFMIGDGEDVMTELNRVILSRRENGWTRGNCLRELAKLEGVYVPSLYDVTYEADGRVR